jgi:hypothetical protein
MVAAVVGSPGTPKRIEVISPVVFVTVAIPRRKAKASTDFILTIKGSIIARVVGPPNPGSIPTANPIAIPKSIRLKVVQLNIWKNPEMKALTISGINLFFLGGR